MIDTQVPGSPGWWLKTLSDKLTERQERITLLRSYMDGSAPLPEGAEGMREAYRAFQRKARTNFGELVVQAAQERMIPAGFAIGDDPLDDRALEIWDANELDVFAGDVHTDMLAVGDGYVIVNGTEDGVPVITREDPSLIITERDPLRPNKIVAALKLFRDTVAETDYAYLYLPGVVYVAERHISGVADTPGTGIEGFAWVPGKAPQRLPAGMEDVIPVVRFRNRNGRGEFEAHTDLLDRINYTVLQRLVITAIQAFKQRAIKGDFDDNAGFDDAGEPIPVDYAAILKPGPGALWMLPEGTDLWESGQTDLTPLLTAAKDDIRDLAAVTRTPMSMLLPDGANQSAEGAQFAREGLIFKTNDRIKRATYGWNQVMALALRFDGAPVEKVTTEWLPPERLTLSERADAASKLVDLPWRSKMIKIMQFEPEEVDRMEQERLSDVLSSVIQATAPATPAAPAVETNGV